MQNLFNMTPPVSAGVLRFPSWNYVRTGLRRNLATVVQYYRNNPMAVPSSHLLVRLLHGITVPQGMSVDRYYDNVDAIALNLSMALKMTSSIYKGRVFDGEFYGKDSPEIIIGHNDWFNPEQAHTNWRNLQPVKILRHPFTNLGLHVPNGKRSGTEQGFSVISINIPLLAIQYRAFRMEEQRLADYMGTTDQRSMYQFLHMYPLTNALFTQLDQTVFNRIEALFYGKPMGESLRRHSFFLTDFSAKMTEAQLKILDSIERNGKSFNIVLETIPAVVRDTLQEVAQLPDMAPTRQVRWALVIARLEWMVFLFGSAKGAASTRNQQEVSAIKRTLTKMRSESTWRSVLSGESLFEVQMEIDVLLNT